MVRHDQTITFDGEPVLSVRATARRLGVTTAAVHELCARGELRHTRVLDVIRIPASALANLGAPAPGVP